MRGSVGLNTLVLVVALLCCRGSRAQVSSELLPDPIDSRVLTRQLQRHVQPSAEQWMLIEKAHRDYLERFGQLERTEFEPHRRFVDTRMSGVPDEATIREFLRRLKSMRRVIATQDETLLLEISEALDDPQQVGLSHLRALREIDRLSLSYRSRSNPDQAVALWRIVDQWIPGLTPEEILLTRAALRDYASNLLPALRTWQEAQDAQLVSLADQLAAAGVRAIPSQNSDPEALEQLLATIRAGLEAARLEMTRTAERIEKVNLRLLLELESLLPDGVARQLRMNYLGRKHPEGGIDPDPARILAAARLLFADPEVATGVKDSVREVLVAYLASDIRLVTRLDALLDASPGAPDEEQPRIFEEQGEVARLRLELAEQVVRSLGELLVQSDRAVVAGLFGPNGIREYVSENEASSRDRADGPSQESIARTRGGPGDFMLRPISTRTINEIRRLLDEDSFVPAILDALYADYLEDWTQRVDPLVDRCNDAQARTHRFTPDDGRVVQDRESLDDSYLAARQAAEAIRELDQAFFDDLIATSGGLVREHLRHHRYRRLLDLLLRGSDPFFNPRGVSYATPNVLAILDRARLTPAESAMVEAHLVEHGEALLDRARDARDVRFDSELRMHLLNQSMSSKLAEGAASSTEYGIAYRRLSDQLLAAHGLTVREWSRAYDTFAEGLLECLGPENRERQRRRWQEASHPMVFRGAIDARTPLEAALALEQLSPRQVESITDLLVEHEVLSGELTAELVDIDRELSAFGAQSTEEDYQRWRTLEQSFKSATFKRRQAAMSSLRQLYLYLTPEQRARVPSLPDFELD